MLDTTAMFAAIAIYIALLVTVGWLAERRDWRLSPRWRAVRHGLSLATLCSAWTYFGAVGEASRGSWLFVANALGPMLAITVFAPVWRRIAVLAKQENVGSLADFLAARYGKSRRLGILVTLVATLGALPYIALQLAVLGRAFSFATARGGDGALEAGALIAGLAALAVVFGTRRPSLTQRNQGFVSMIAVESLIKLSGLVATAALMLVLIALAAPHAPTTVPPVPPLRDALALFATLTFLCTITTVTLPRQFHLAFVTLESPDDIAGAGRVVVGYFALWVAATLAIAVGVRSGYAVAGVDPAMQMLAVPLARGEPGVAMLAWLGGLSAGGAMVIVELTALSAMVSNEIVLPLIAPRLRHNRLAGREIGGAIVLVRRLTIAGIALLALVYHLGSAGAAGPTEQGLTALTAFAQLVPPLVGGLYWRRGHARGAMAGLIAGIAVWAWLIAAPAFLGAHGAIAGPAVPVEAAVAISLMANVACFVGFSWSAEPRLIDQIQANSFVAGPSGPAPAPRRAIEATMHDLRRLLAQFLGEAEAARALADIARDARRRPDDADAAVSPQMVRAAERVLAGVIGAPSARNVVAIAIAAGEHDAAAIARILDEAGDAVHFSRELLQTTLESLPQGVCVIDSGALIVAWNAPFLGFMGLDPGAVHVGAPLPELLEAGRRPGAREAFDRWRGAQSRSIPMAEEGPLGEGAETRVFSLTGRSLPGGDYLMTLADITELKRAEQVLTQNQEALEARVEERTRELTQANAALESARALAEAATGVQRRFVAAASHDLVQPMHAARLFIGNALLGKEHGAEAALLARADQAVEGAHRMLQALLKLSQLELGALKPHVEPVDAAALLRDLAAEFEPLAHARQLQLACLPGHDWVRTDRDLLRSILQNLLVNALRYTPHGRVVLAARRRGPDLRIEVRDSGVGIDPLALPEAFGEFARLAEGAALAEGAGLGLSIVARIAQALDHPLDVRSRPGLGSTFAVTVPRTRPAPVVTPVRLPAVDLAGLCVLCIDDDADVLTATAALIRRWGAEVIALPGADGVPTARAFDAVIADYKLAQGNGLNLLRDLAGRAALRLLVTATPDDLPGAALAAEGIEVMTKPLPPLALRARLAGLLSPALM